MVLIEMASFSLVMTILSFSNRNSHPILAFQLKGPLCCCVTILSNLNSNNFQLFCPLLHYSFHGSFFSSSISLFSTCPIYLWYHKFELEQHFAYASFVVSSVYSWLPKKTGPRFPAEVPPSSEWREGLCYEAYSLLILNFLEFVGFLLQPVIVFHGHL